jgi:hypothetical protein
MLIISRCTAIVIGIAHFLKRQFEQAALFFRASVTR